MKKSNARTSGHKKECERRSKAEQKQRPVQSRKMLVGHEIVQHSDTLRRVGQEMKYSGGFRFGPGSADYRKMSAVVAEMAEKVGAPLHRTGKMRSAQFMLGLPEGEYFGVSYTAYKHDRRLPSVALVDTTQTAANIQYYYDTNIRGQAQFAALTLPALEQRITIENYEASVDLAFKRWNKFKQSFKEAGLGEFIYVQLEDPFDPETQTFYLHFHAFLTIGFGDSSRRKALAFIKSAMNWTESFAGLHLKVIPHECVHNAIRYGTKPSATAYQIAVSRDEATFSGYLTKSRKKRFTRTESKLKATLKNLKEQGRRATFHRCEALGRQTVRLVEKREVPAPEAGDAAAEEDETGSGVPVHKEASRSSKSNIYCGCGQPVASPDGRLRAFGFIQGFEEESFAKFLEVGGTGSFFEANRAARTSWERNTGKRFDLKEFLRPIAKYLLDILKGNEVQSYTVIASPRVLTVLREIENELSSPRRTGTNNTGSARRSPLNSVPKFRWLFARKSLHLSLRKSTISAYGREFWAGVVAFVARLKSKSH